jgi:UPF0755 protein
MKKLIVLTVLIFIIFGAYFSHLNQAKNIIYQVKPGSNITLIADELQQQNVIASSVYVKLLAKFIGENPKVGYYQIDTIWQFLTDINNNTVKTGSVVFIPGKTIKEYYNTLKSHTFINTTKSLTQIMQELNIPKPYEGRFLPQTYYYNYGDSAQSIFARSYELMNAKLNIIWGNRDKNQYIKTPYDLLKLASIVEKESGNEAEKAKIAGVFINRLKKNMRLQSDVTTIYGMGDAYNGVITKKDLQAKNAYNTYKIKGLPQGAISNPSIHSIIAASKPQSHQLLYFVAKNSKEHIFAITYAQHRENIKKYLKNK